MELRSQTSSFQITAFSGDVISRTPLAPSATTTTAIAGTSARLAASAGGDGCFFNSRFHRAADDALTLAFRVAVVVGDGVW